MVRLPERRSEPHTWNCQSRSPTPHDRSSRRGRPAKPTLRSSYRLPFSSLPVAVLVVVVVVLSVSVAVVQIVHVVPVLDSFVSARRAVSVLVVLVSCVFLRRLRHPGLPARVRLIGLLSVCAIGKHLHIYNSRCRTHCLGDVRERAGGHPGRGLDADPAPTRWDRYQGCHDPLSQELIARL